MNICVLGLRGVPDVMGGVETHCEQLFPLLQRMRPGDSFVIIGRRRYLPNRLTEYLGVRVVALAHASDRRLETVTNAVLGIFYARFVAHADVLHIQGIGAAIVIPLAKLFGMKIIVTYHSKNYEHGKWGSLARALLRLGELFALRLGDCIISVSKTLGEELSERFPGMAHKIYFIPNGANHLTAQPETPESDALLKNYELKEQSYIISVGRLVPEKGLHDLIDAFNAAQLPNCKLVLVGNADYQDDYSRRLRGCAGERIIFTGFLRRDSISILLRSASLFVLPSYNEGMPIAALEAVMAGCPVLLSDILPNQALGLPSRNYFACGSVNALCGKLKADHDGYRVDSSMILENYNWNTTCAQTNKLYSSLEETLRVKQGWPGRRWATRH
jgi:glycosyltransferase involved in cell wall biosynthesis